MAQHVEESDGRPSTLPSAASTVGRRGGYSSADVKQLKKKLSYVLQKAYQRSDEIISLKKANSKLQGEIAKEVLCREKEEKKHRELVAGLQGDIHAMQERMKERALRFVASKEKMSANLNLKIEGYKAKVASLKKDAVNVDQMKSIEVALSIKEGEGGLDACRRYHDLAWER